MSGVEVYCALGYDFYGCFEVDRAIILGERTTLLEVLEGIVGEDAIDDLGKEWLVRFDALQLMPQALWRILGTLCNCNEGDQLDIDLWWT